MVRSEDNYAIINCNSGVTIEAALFDETVVHIFTKPQQKLKNRKAKVPFMLQFE